MTAALVTGACGFMGSHLVDHLLAQGMRVRATDLAGADRTFLNPKAEFVPSDLTLPESLKGLCLGVDRLFHVAALFNYSAPYMDLYRANVMGTRSLLRTALDEAKGLKSVVLWGAAGLYGLHMKPPVGEDAPLEPGNDYLKTKLAQEDVAFDFHRAHGLPVTVLRIASPYGPRAKYGAFLTLKLIALGQAPPFLVGSGTQRVGGMIHAVDVARIADFVSLRPERTAGQIYNVSDDTAYTAHELTLFLGEQLGWPFYRWPRVPLGLALRSAKNLDRKFRKLGKPPPVPMDMAEYAQMDCVLDTSKFKALGCDLLYPDCMIGLKETIAWYRERGWLPPLEDGG
jgi:nucleoside-diphosphate-sugar epimerase